MKTSPNISAAGIVNGVFRRIVAEKLLISAQAPLGLAGQLVRQHDDAGASGLGKLRGHFLRDGQRPRVVQFGGKFNGLHGRSVSFYTRRINPRALTENGAVMAKAGTNSHAQAAARARGFQSNLPECGKEAGELRLSVGIGFITLDTCRR